MQHVVAPGVNGRGRVRRAGRYRAGWKTWIVLGLALVPAALGCVPAPRLTVSAAQSGLSIPWDVAWTPSGNQMLYTERPYGLTIVGGNQPLLHWKPADLLVASEAGMMSLAVAPDFAASRRIFVCFASTLGPDVRIARLTLSPYLLTVEHRTDVLSGIPVNAEGELGRHSGCRLKFGPDGYLWVGTGDAAVGTAPQDPTSLAGKVLRIDQNGAPAPGNMGAPFDSRIESYGHRNVQGLAFRGGQAFDVEHGPGCDDEVNLLRTGGNYGWDPVPRTFGDPAYNEEVPMTDTVRYPFAVRATWSSGCPTIAPSGATFVNGPQWGYWNGGLVMAVLKDTHLRMLRISSDGLHVTAGSFALTDHGRLRTPAVGPDGALYVTTSNGADDAILRVQPSSVTGG
jgi:aldose sugar dehydrogenase